MPTCCVYACKLILGKKVRFRAPADPVFSYTLRTNQPTNAHTHIRRSFYSKMLNLKLQQDRYARTSIRDSTCDAVPQGSTRPRSTRPLKLEPSHDVAIEALWAESSRETPIDGDTDRLALVLFFAVGGVPKGVYDILYPAVDPDALSLTVSAQLAIEN